MTQDEFDAQFGVDISVGVALDVTPEFAEVTGLQGYIEACIRRLSTTPGDLFYDVTYGYNLVDVASDSFAPADIPQIESAVCQQLQLDERTSRASCSIGNVTLEGFDAHVGVVTDAGPFKFTLGIDKVTVTLLNQQAANG